MGQDQSSPADPGMRPRHLKSRTLEALAEYITSGAAKKIVVMTGAGISTSAGIPDFRSPETGLYANLARLNLPYPEAVFDISYFREHPEPFYALAQELYPGKYRPTITHSFITLLHKKGLLLKCFSQNIDCLEREAGLPDDMIVEAHGSFARHSCIECRKPFPEEEMKKAIKAKAVPHCPSCGGLVKPEIVFFGEQLPQSFFTNRELPCMADLAIIMGTSLSVQPFASLPQFVSDGVPRLLINLEQVGGLGSRPDDVVVLEDCDSGVRKLAKACGWLEELEELWAQTARDHYVQPSVAPKAPRDHETAEDEVEKLTRDVEESLKLASTHTDEQKKWLEEHLEDKHDKIEDSDVPVDGTFEYKGKIVGDYEKEPTAPADARPEDVKPPKPTSAHVRKTSQAIEGEIEKKKERIEHEDVPVDGTFEYEGTIVNEYEKEPTATADALPENVKAPVDEAEKAKVEAGHLEQRSDLLEQHLEAKHDQIDNENVPVEGSRASDGEIISDVTKEPTAPVDAKPEDVATEREANTGSDGGSGGGLSHVFPHLKPSVL